MPEHVVRLPNGITMPTLGQGTWFMGESSSAKKEEIAALQHGIDLGMTLIDTAEMYASGGAEKVTGEAIAGRRDKIFLGSAKCFRAMPAGKEPLLRSNAVSRD